MSLRESQNTQDRVGEFQQRLIICLVIVISFFGVIFVRLAYLQIVKGRDFLFFSAEHAIKEIRVPATRGIIYDRNHLPIVENRPSFDLVVVPQDIKNKEKVMMSHRAGLDSNPEKIKMIGKMENKAAE